MDDYKIDANKEFKRGIKLRDERKYNEAISCFNDLIKNPHLSNESYKFHLVLGGIYNELKMYKKALRSCSLCLLKKPDSELASLGKYVAYVNLEQYDDAIREIISFLNNYPADLYLDTLDELRTAIKEGDINSNEFIKSLQTIFIKNNILF